MTDMNALYYKDPYLREFDAETVSCIKGKKGYEIVLTETAFYPEGGGQPYDTGTLNGIAVKEVHEKDDVIIHYCDQPLSPGEKVHGVIDWDRRFDLMQNHTGEHIFSGLVHRLYGWENVGFHMGDVIQIDFSGPLTWEEALRCEHEANETIMRNEEVLITFPDPEELKTLEYRSKKELTGIVRIVEVPGADVCACCGTHVKRSGEIGLIKLLSLEKHKDGVRLEIVSGRRAVSYMDTVFDQNRQVSFLLSAPLKETYPAVQRLNEANAKLKKQMNETLQKILKERLEQVEPAKVLCDILPYADKLSMRAYCNDLLTKTDGGTAAVFAREDDKCSYLIISKDRDLRQITKPLNEALNGRGGGNREMIQGSVSADDESILRTIYSLLGNESDS